MKISWAGHVRRLEAIILILTKTKSQPTEEKKNFFQNHQKIEVMGQVTTPHFAEIGEYKES